jgi:hypothetical protein
MNAKHTGVWFAIAAVLFAFIFIFQHYLRSFAAESSLILPDLRPAAVISVQVIPSGALEIRADRTNDDWFLAKPVFYPAQPTAVEALLAALQQLKPATRISAAELRKRRDANAEFGFDSPQISLVIEAGGQRWQLLVGNKTAPGDQVFLRVVGVEGAFVTDADWLKFIPRSANEWRDTALVDFRGSAPDWIVLTNGTKVIELRRNPTNHLWWMLRPLQARADSELVIRALQRLQTARVSQFVTDDAKADLGTFGLEPADVDLWSGRGTNLAISLHVGKSPTNDLSQVYARREGWNTVVTTAKEALTMWHGAVNDFRDPYLLELTAPVAEIEVRGEKNFILQQPGTNSWRLTGENFPVDAANVQEFIKVLAGLRVAEFVKDVVTAPDLPAYGLATPARQIILRSAVGDTNAVIAQLSFGATQGKEVFVRRADEDFVYAVTAEDFNRLPEAGWEFRDRRIWNFSETNVAQITVHQNGKTRQIMHNGKDQWSLAPGSQGIINDLALSEVAHRLGELAAVGWVAGNLTNAAPYGFKPENLSLTVELKSGQKLTVDFGGELPSAQTALAAVTLDGGRWAFVFPPGLYQFVLNYLTIPANVP